jgi:hypothetical protein
VAVQGPVDNRAALRRPDALAGGARAGTEEQGVTSDVFGSFGRGHDLRGHGGSYCLGDIVEAGKSGASGRPRFNVNLTLLSEHRERFS